MAAWRYWHIPTPAWTLVPAICLTAHWTTHFGDAGKVGPGSSDQYLSRQPGDGLAGQFLVAGCETDSSTGNNFAVGRYLTDGSLDTGFGDGGRVLIDFGSS